MGNWLLIHSDEVLNTKWIRVLKNAYKITNGSIINDYYVIERSDFVLVVAKKGDNLILVKQYRPATDRYYLALPAGFLQPNEELENCAKRELEEETGYTTRSCLLIGELHPLPGYIKSKAFVLFCEVTERKNSELDFLEISEVVEVNISDVMGMIARGEINEMQAVAALLLAKERSLLI